MNGLLLGESIKRKILFEPSFTKARPLNPNRNDITLYRYVFSGKRKIQGTVYFDGVPSKAVVVFCIRETQAFFQVETDDLGNFTLDNVSTDYDITLVAKRNFNEAYRTLEDTETNVEINIYSGTVIPNTHKVEGRIYNYQGNPVARKVCIFSKTTDQFLGSMISDETTGFYSIGFVSPDPVYVVCFPNENEDINAKIYDRIVPVAI